MQLEGLHSKGSRSRRCDLQTQSGGLRSCPAPEAKGCGGGRRQGNEPGGLQVRGAQGRGW